MEPEQNRSEAQSEQEWELSDQELDRIGFVRASAPCCSNLFCPLPSGR